MFGKKRIEELEALVKELEKRPVVLPPVPKKVKAHLHYFLSCLGTWEPSSSYQTEKQADRDYGVRKHVPFGKPIEVWE